MLPSRALHGAGLFGLVTLANAMACSATSAPAAPDPTTQPPGFTPLCAPRDGSVCSSLVDPSGSRSPTLDVPARMDAIVWAELSVAATASGRTPSRPTLALYDDGTLRRTPVLRNFTFIFEPPRGLLVAHVSPAWLASVKAHLAGLPDDDLRGYFGPDEPLQNIQSEESNTILTLPRGSACFLSGTTTSGCTPVAVLTLRDDMNALAVASENAWRATQSGTVSLLGVQPLVGDWPLADARAPDGDGSLTSAELAQLSGTGTYRLHDGSYVTVEVIAGKASSDGTSYVYFSRRSAITLGDDMAALRQELLTNEGRYALTKGSWLGVALGPDRFPALKNRDLAIVPGQDGAPDTLHGLLAIEQLDVRGDGDLVQP